MRLKVTSRFLWMPADRTADTVKLSFLHEGARFQEIDIRLGITHAEYYVFMDVSRYVGKSIDICSNLSEEALQVLCCKNERPSPDNSNRPLVHYTADIGWINDPNGLVYADGTYHLYHQWNPYGTEWGNMHWGHAVSRDLITWEHKGVVMEPDITGTMYSGCGWHDQADAAAFGKGALLFFYTASGGCNQWSIEAGNQHTQHLAVSTDGGNTLQKQGMILPHIRGGNRDPKVFYHRESNAYIMVLFLDDYEFAVFRSADLIHWTESQRFSAEKMRECPDLFELPVENEPDVKKWVFWSADGYYLIGSFDGFRFTPESEVLSAYSTVMAYAAQTYAGVKNRVISVAWHRTGNDRGNYRGMMSIPNELTLVRTDHGLRIRFQPVREIWNCFKKREELLPAAGTASLPLHGKPAIAEITWEPGWEKKVVIGNNSIPIRATGNEVLLLIDHGIIEFWADDGTVYGAAETDQDALDGCLAFECVRKVISYEYCRQEFD